MASIRLAGLRVLAAVGCAMAAAASHGGGLGVSPIRIDLAAAAPTAAITLENTGDTAMVLQLQVTRWNASDDKDRYEPSQDILATPPIMRIAPGRSQVVRLGMIGVPVAPTELAYRLFIEEVPAPPQAGTPALQVALRIGVPIFVRPAQPVQPALDWDVVDRDGAAALRVRNGGGAHARLLAVKLSADGQEEVTLKGAAAYLLVGQERLLMLPAHLQRGPGRLAVSATTDRGPVGAELAWPDR